MECSGFRYSRHAIERMFTRRVEPDVVERVVSAGEVIVSYADEKPFPSLLLLGFDDDGPVHVVAANDPDTGLCYVITIYRPEPELWSDDFRTRRGR
jgi:hypothetical protein